MSPVCMQCSLSTGGMLALLAFVSKVNAGITRNLVSLGSAEAPLLPGCQPHHIINGFKTSTEPLHALCWLLVGVRWGVEQSPFFFAESPLSTIDPMLGKLALRLSYLLLPLSRAQWKLLRSHISNRKKGQLVRAELLLSIFDHAVPLSFTLVGPIPNFYGHGVPGPPSDLLPGFQIESGQDPSTLFSNLSGFQPRERSKT